MVFTGLVSTCLKSGIVAEPIPHLPRTDLDVTVEHTVSGDSEKTCDETVYCTCDVCVDGHSAVGSGTHILTAINNR